MTRASLLRFIVVLLALVAAACAKRPDFDIDKAQVELAQAFERGTREVAVYGDGRGPKEAKPPQWIIDFRVDGIQPSLQARFLGLKDRWELSVVRLAPAGSEETPWESIGVLLGRMRGRTAEAAELTIERMKELTDFIGQYSVRNGNRFPVHEISGLKTILIADGTVQERNWQHDVDAWGQGLVYHAAPDGLSYVLVSPGADGLLDRPQEEYFTNADQGLEAYAGASTNPNADIVVASGEMVQYFAR